MFKVDKGIAIPQSKSDSASKYPFNTMEIGDSFVFDTIDSGKVYVASRSDKLRKQNKRFMARKLNDGKSRIWRVS